MATKNTPAKAAKPTPTENPEARPNVLPGPGEIEFGVQRPGEDNGVMKQMIAAGQKSDAYDRSALDTALEKAGANGPSADAAKEAAKLSDPNMNQPIVSDDRNKFLPATPPEGSATKEPVTPAMPPEPKPEPKPEEENPDEKFPEVELAERFIEKTSEPEVTDENIDGVIKKFYGDEELTDEQRKLVEPLAKSYLNSQQSYQETRSEIETLKGVVDELKAGDGDKLPQSMPTETPEVKQPSAKPEKPADTSELNEDMVEEIYEKEGLTGILKLAESRFENRQKQADSQRAAAEQKQTVTSRNQHNADMVVSRSREYLANSAAANRNSADYKKYSNPKYEPTEAEISKVWEGFVSPELEFIQKHHLVDSGGMLQPEHFEIATTYLNREATKTASDRRGYERAMKDVRSASKGPTDVVMQEKPLAQHAGGKPNIFKMTNAQDIQREIAKMSPAERDAHLEKLRQSNYSV